MEDFRRGNGRGGKKIKKKKEGDTGRENRGEWVEGRV